MSSRLACRCASTSLRTHILYYAYFLQHQANFQDSFQQLRKLSGAGSSDASLEAAPEKRPPRKAKPV